MAFTFDEGTQLGAVGDPSDYQHVETVAGASRLCRKILARREQPVIAVTLRVDEDTPVLDYEDVRAVVGPSAAIYLIARDDLLAGMRELLGSGLSLGRGMARVWWPGVDARADGVDHPLIVALEGEPSRITLEELAQQFDLSRPRVRGHIRLIEDTRALAEHELAQARQQSRIAGQRLRDVQIECHSLRVRAREAEARLAAIERAIGPEPG